MKPGTRVAMLGTGCVYLGRLVQPVHDDGTRRWSVDWDDGLVTASTFPEGWLFKVVPQ